MRVLVVLAVGDPERVNEAPERLCRGFGRRRRILGPVNQTAPAISPVNSQLALDRADFLFFLDGDLLDDWKLWLGILNSVQPENPPLNFAADMLWQRVKFGLVAFGNAVTLHNSSSRHDRGQFAKVTDVALPKKSLADLLQPFFEMAGGAQIFAVNFVPDGFLRLNVAGFKHRDFRQTHKPLAGRPAVHGPDFLEPIFDAEICDALANFVWLDHDCFHGFDQFNSAHLSPVTADSVQNLYHFYPVVLANQEQRARHPFGQT